MVPFEHHFSVPLLPHEKQLIEALGLTAEEYRVFTQDVIWRSRERPAAYDGVPDIRCEPISWTTVAVSLLIGGLTTAASYFLTPKPEAPQASRIRNRQLDSIVGRDRFSPTYGFQSSQDISRYGEAIPIVFTRQTYDAGSRTFTGGVMVSPKLVWSRIFSWGTYQTAHLVFLVGQGPMPRGPYSTATEIAADRAGLYVGQAPIDSLPESDYRWFYYSGGTPNANGIGYTTTSRLLGRHDRYGELPNAAVADADNAFFAPTFAGGDSEAFCHSYSPSAQLRFGTFAGIPNGTPYRVNWEIVPRLNDYDDNAKREANAKRLQVAGNFKMKGPGRNYPRRVGLFKRGNAEVASSYSGNDGILVNDITKGERVSILFGGPRLNKDLWWDSRVYDPSRDGDKVDKDVLDNESIVADIASELEQIDDQLQPGTRFVIGNCLFRVESRNPTEAFYRRRHNEFEVVLICEEIYDDGYVPNGQGALGFVPRQYVLSDKPMPETGDGPQYDIGQGWFPICQSEVASFQNVRECDTTEIGIRSQVWLRFNGLTNLISVPGPDRLANLDDKNIQMRAGTVQSYSYRTSFFSLYVRPANALPTDKWVRLNKYPLCVRGNAPRDQYNFVRVAHAKGQYEFRLRPHNAGEVIRIIGRTNKCFQLTAAGTFVRSDVNVPFSANPFVLYVKGIEATISDFATSPEMINNENGASSGAGVVNTTYTVSLIRAEIPAEGRPATAKEVSNGITKAIGKDPDRDASEDIYPNIPWGGTTEGGFYTFTDSEAALFNIGGAFNLRMQLQSYQESGPYNSNREWFWRIVSIGTIRVNEAEIAKITNGQTFQVSKTVISGRTIVYTFTVTLTKTQAPITIDAERIFESNTAISEVSHYGGLVTRSCDSNPEHEIVYVGESVSRGTNATYEGCAMAGIKLRSSRNMNQLEQLRLYQTNGINVQRYIMEPGRVERDLGVGPSNLFTDLVRFLLLNQQAGIGSIFSDQLLDETELRRTAMFLNANRLFYDDVLTEPVNIREFVARVAPSLLCNMVTRNGKFSIEPAVPYHDGGQIIDGSNLVTVPISAIFTEGNIIEDTFELRYLNAEERKPMRAAVRYRSERLNQFPEERTVIVSYNDDPAWANAPLEEFDFSHITSLDHAVMVGKYFLAIRRRVRHSVSFKTSPYGISLAPGNYIRVITEANIYDPTMNNGAILDDGTIVSVDSMPDGNYDVFLWLRSIMQVTETTLTVQNGIAGGHRNALFAVRNNTSNNLCYVVESLQLDEDGLVQVTASQFPVDDNGKSLIAKDLTWLNSGIFRLETSA